MDYYNELDPYAAQWLRNLIGEGLIPNGLVDERDIRLVRGDDLRGFRHCHFFAGIGGWALAAEIAGWPDDRPVWTGSCPCQPFSVAGKGAGQSDSRHLWPEWFRLIRECRPPTIFGEQVSAAIGKGWLDRVSVDLESEGYSIGSVVLPACAVGAPHRRDRLWFVGYAERPGLEGLDGDGDHRDGSGWGDSVKDRSAAATCRGSNVADPGVARLAQRESDAGVLCEACGTPARENATDDVGAVANTRHDDGTAWSAWGQQQPEASERERFTGTDHWSSAGDSWIVGHDGKSRRVEPSIPLLVDGAQARVGRLRAYGNAIVPQLAAEVMSAFMECRP